MQFYDSFGLRFVLQTRPLHLPVSASCSSDRDFAADFLQIPSHDRHPCLELTLPTIMACSGFAPYSYHPCRANKSGQEPFLDRKKTSSQTDSSSLTALECLMNHGGQPSAHIDALYP